MPGVDLYLSSTEVALVKEADINVQIGASSVTLKITPVFQKVFKGGALPEKFSIVLPLERAIACMPATMDPKSQRYVLLFLCSQNSWIGRNYVFVGSDPTQMYISVDMGISDVNNAKSLEDLLALMLSSRNATTRMQGLGLAGGLKSRVIDALVPLTNSDNPTEKGLAYKDLLESGQTGFLNDFITFLDTECPQGIFYEVRNALLHPSDEQSMNIMSLRMLGVKPEVRETLFRSVFGGDPNERLRKAGRLIAHGKEAEGLREIYSLLNRPVPSDEKTVHEEVLLWTAVFAQVHLGPEALWHYK